MGTSWLQHPPLHPQDRVQFTGVMKLSILVLLSAAALIQLASAAPEAVPDPDPAAVPDPVNLFSSFDTGYEPVQPVNRKKARRGNTSWTIDTGNFATAAAYRA